MSKLVFILGAPNGRDGELSSVSLKRIDAAIEIQRNEPGTVLLATGGFGTHFNQTETPHREFVHRRLEVLGAAFDRAGGHDLLSSNTVEDIVFIKAFAVARNVDSYSIVTSSYHVARCRFIVDCLASDQTVTVVSAEDPKDLSEQAREHESRAGAAQSPPSARPVLHQ